MLARELDNLSRMRRHQLGVSAHDLKEPIHEVSPAHRREVCGVIRALHHRPANSDGAIDMAKRPRRASRESHGCNAGVLAKTKGQIAVALRIEDCQRLFEAS